MTTPAGAEQGAGSSSAETTAMSSTSSSLTGSALGGTTSVPAIDAVLMDCEMPVLSGFDAARCIRELEQIEGKGRHTSIIAVTASAMTGDRERCLAAGMDGYLAKPVRFQQLKAKIEKHLSTAAAPPGGSASVGPPGGKTGRAAQAQPDSEHGQATAET